MDYMENILEELFLCGIYPEFYKSPDTPEYHERLERSEALEEKLLDRLSGEEKELYNQLRKNLNIVFDLEMMQSFVTGYLLASQIMLDVAAKMNDPKLVSMRKIIKKALRKTEMPECFIVR